MRNFTRTSIIGLLTVLILSLTNVNLKAQEEEESPISVGADIVSRYIWRGVNLGGASPHVQPGIELSLGNSGLAIGAWGSYALSGGIKAAGNEADLYISYTLPNDMFSVTLTDYFFPGEGGGEGYFNYSTDLAIDPITGEYKEAHTGHTMEAIVSFNGTENFPLTAMFAVNIWGADAIKVSDDGTQDFINSMYFELGYSGDVKGIELGGFIGAALNDNKDMLGGTGFYGQESAGIINLGITASKEIKITDNFSLPISGSLIFNPEREDIFMVLAISL